MAQTQVDKTDLGIHDFFTYPPVGEDDYAYMFQTAQVRTLETQMLTRTTLTDMANASDFASAAGSLSGSEYTLGQGAGAVEIETMLQQRRTAVRGLFEDLMLDERIAEVFRSRGDYANLRLILRRVLTDKPVGEDFSDEGNVPPAVLRQAFEEQNFAVLPEYVQTAADQATLAYYQNKNVRQIDNAIDHAQAAHRLDVARCADGGVFLTNLFRIQTDLTNLRTMLRVKFLQADPRDVFLEGGFVEMDRLRQGLDLPYEALGALFFSTPYHHVVEAGGAYVASSGSFLKVEQQCDDYLTGYLKQTMQVASGPQPVVAFLLAKEHEIRTVRLILTAKRNALDTKLILDRLS
ncbi:MAG TPA: V-type ATPase subunit [Sedimentisphaerales bacterium]|jgi:V/A-type H+-transporting ATPase subunit C|nr:V-type ATPase subunit [Sedimentisphaerales bacterium]HNU30404.1 V-type ATPase subunit [Sedimentisphaerales bacterium]